MNDEDTNFPLLGLATTRELLEEIKARGDIEEVITRGKPHHKDAVNMSTTAANLLTSLPSIMLAYRTVDGH